MGHQRIVQFIFAIPVAWVLPVSRVDLSDDTLFVTNDRIERDGMPTEQFEHLVANLGSVVLGMEHHRGFVLLRPYRREVLEVWVGQ